MGATLAHVKAAKWGFVFLTPNALARAAAQVFHTANVLSGSLAQKRL